MGPLTSPSLSIPSLRGLISMMSSIPPRLKKQLFNFRKSIVFKTMTMLNGQESPNQYVTKFAIYFCIFMETLSNFMGLIL